MTHNEKVQQAKKEFGEEPVEVAIEMVAASDPDGAYAMFEDNNMWKHAEIVSMIYFAD